MPPDDPGKQDARPAILRLRTLGDAALDLLDEQNLVLDHQEISKALALVTYLASTPTQAASREHLIDLLWSDLDVDAGKHALRQHLWHLRRRFGEVLVADRKGVVRVGQHIDFDRADLLAAAERGHCERVAELYRGEFFVGFAAPGSNEFERWADMERSRLGAVFIRCAEQLVRQWLSSGRMRDGQTLARRVRDADPDAQHAWRLLIEAHISAGDELGARVEADAFEQRLLADEAEAEPASRALIATARRGQTPKSEEAKAPFSDLVGRETEFAWLMQAWNAAVAGRATCVHIVAPAGFGKSRLLQDFRARLASLRARVTFTRADAGCAGIPLALVSDIVSALGAIPGAGGVTPEVAASLVGLAPSLASTYPAARAVQAGDEPHVRRSAVRDLLAAIAEERPLAVLVDDLHWSDPESVALLSGALGSLGSLGKLRLLVVIAQRPTGSAQPFVAEAQQFTLAPLSDSSIAALLANVASLPPAEWSDNLAQELRRATGGSPLLVVETLHLAMQRDILAVAHGEWRCTNADALTELLRAGGAVQQRIERLDHRERELMLLLSIARMPLPLPVLRAAAAQSMDELRAVLATLELRGLVTHSHEDWVIGHDEYAAATLAGLTVAEAPALHASLGRALAERTGHDDRLRRLAPYHLRIGNDWESLGPAFAGFVADRKQRGTRRTVYELSCEFLGTDSIGPDTQRLAGMLPFGIRVRLATPQRRATALLFALAAPAAGLWFALSPTAKKTELPDNIAVIGISDNSGGVSLHELPIFGQRQTVDMPLVLARDEIRTVHISHSYGVGAEPSPISRDEWLTMRAVSDSGVTDIFLTNTRDGTEQRLTFSRGDDANPIWSPDGSLIAFASARWSELGHTSLAIMDVRTRRVRRLTAGDATDTGPHWSPDGSRVAFTRVKIDGQRVGCVVPISGGESGCFSFPFDVATQGWLTDTTLSMTGVVAGQLTLLGVGVPSGALHTIGQISNVPELSPDGLSMLCDCRAVGAQQPSLMLMRTADATIVRRIETPGLASGTLGFTWRAPSVRRYISRITASKGLGEPLIGVPYHITTQAFDAADAPRSIPFQTFTVSDSGIASVSPEGVLTAHHAGRTTVRVSAGGWRTDSLVLNIRDNLRDTVAVDDWRNGLGPNWISFGDPVPGIIRDVNGANAFTTAGDGRFHSGALSRAEYPASDGLTLSADFSTPVTLGQWQELEVIMQDGIDTAKVRRWRSDAGYLWGDGRVTATKPQCGITYPAGTEGARYADVIRLSGPMPAPFIAAPAKLRTGRLTKLTLQLFPDGRCGAALDGVAIGVTAATSASLLTARLVLLGNSFRTKVLVGPVLLRRGVDTSIDWEKAPPKPY